MTTDERTPLQLWTTRRNTHMAAWAEQHPAPDRSDRQARTAWERARYAAGCAWDAENPRPEPTAQERVAAARLKALHGRMTRAVEPVGRHHRRR